MNEELRIMNEELRIKNGRNKRNSEFGIQNSVGKVSEKKVCYVICVLWVKNTEGV